MPIVLCFFFFPPFGVPLPLHLYQGGRVYNKINQVGYNMISIMTISLLAYFTHILIDIIIYAFERTTWSSKIF
jgi:hypothetical protein